MLIRYAELCENYGLQTEAKKAYGLAVNAAADYSLGVQMPLENLSLTQMKALTKIALIAHKPGGLSGNINEVSALVKQNHQIAAGYMFLADGFSGLGKADEAHAALMKAQSLGTPGLRNAVEKMHARFSEQPASPYAKRYGNTVKPTQ